MQVWVTTNPNWHSLLLVLVCACTIKYIYDDSGLTIMYMYMPMYNRASPGGQSTVISQIFGVLLFSVLSVRLFHTST